MMSTTDKRRRQRQRRRRQRRTINWKDGGHQRETTVTRDSDERWRRQRIGDDDCGGLRRLPRTAMAMDDDDVEQQRHVRAGGGQRWGRNKTEWRTKTAFGIYKWQYFLNKATSNSLGAKSNRRGIWIPQYVERGETKKSRKKG